MAAGLGFKDFTTGEVLTAADVDGYLMQGIWVFADSAARAAAVTSPQEGNMSFLKDTNSTEYYTGSAWTSIAGASGGMTSIASGTLSSTAVDLTSIAQTYRDLYLIVTGAYFVTTNSQCVFRFNSDSGANYNQWYALLTSTTPISETDNTYFQSTRNNVGVATNDSTSILYIRNYATTSAKQITASFSTITDGGGGNYWTFGSYESSTAISSISIRSSNGTSSFGGGTYVLYGVK